MKTRVIGLTLLLGSIAVAVCVAADANMGTWKLNEAKSKLNPSGPKNHTVTYATAGDSVKVTAWLTTPAEIALVPQRREAVLETTALMSQRKLSTSINSLISESRRAKNTVRPSRVAVRPPGPFIAPTIMPRLAATVVDCDVAKSKYRSRVSLPGLSMKEPAAPDRLSM